MAADRLDLTADEGAGLAEPLRWTEADGSPVFEGPWPDGWAASWRAGPNGLAVVELDHVGSNLGQVDLRDDARVVLTLTAAGVDELAARWSWHELELLPPDGEPVRLVEGLIRRRPRLEPAAVDA